jgi:putative heme-binding domain-containing protein
MIMLTRRHHRSLFASALISLAIIGHASAAKNKTDVTATVAAAVKDESLSVPANNAMFGDTVPSVPKKLTIELQVGDEIITKEALEGGRIEYSAPAGKKLLVLKAIYGPVDGAADPSRLTEKPSEVLDTLPGFKVEHVLEADSVTQGSWICMTADPHGRLLLGGQHHQPITRVTLKDGRSVKVETLGIPVTETMGMLFVGDVLYLNGNGSKGFGLYRCRDPKGDGSYDAVEHLRVWEGGSGEHGAHALILGQDKMLYAVCGNFTKVPGDLIASSPHRHYGDDVALPRMEDGNGFGAGAKPPGGYVLRMDLDGKNAELFSSGQRNNYDIAFNADGEMFGYDSDMEWDWGTPWYRPTRTFHAVRGGDHGYREGSAKWPESYPDSLPATVNIGIGCPTGVVFGTGAHFPAKYQKALYICDWTYGRLIAVHHDAKGATYTGTWENFVAPRSLRTKSAKVPLNLTDVIIGSDGALYFTIGGRGTQAHLFRVTYEGSEPAKALAAANLQEEAGRAARELRHQLEAMNVAPHPNTVNAAWPHLASPDRSIRYAARLAIERNPVSEWQAKALAEKQPDAAFTALLALARLGGPDTQPSIFQALSALSTASLTEEQLLNQLRVISVSLARQGIPTGTSAPSLFQFVDPLYPAKTEALNRELCQILLALNAPHAVSRTVMLLRAAPTQEEQLTYVVALRNIKTGWTENLRRDFLHWFNGGRSRQHPLHVTQWFKDAGINFNNGASFDGFIKKALQAVTATMTPTEVTALGDLTKVKPTVTAPAEPRQFVKEWTQAELEPLMPKVSRGRDFARGKAAYAAAQCLLCHRYGDEGGASGPDLTNVATRFKRQDLLASILEPSKVLSEQYVITIFTTKDNSVVAGRISQENADTVIVMTNPLDPSVTTTLATADISSRELSKVSLMPPGLLNTFKEDEILDLIAYLESMDDAKHPHFQK